MPSKLVPYWLTPAILKAAVITAGVLFVVSFAVDITFESLQISPARTLVNDLIIAVIATVIVVYYLTSIQTYQNYLRAKERMNLTQELNHHLRRAMVEFRNAAELEDRFERLQMLDRAIEEVDHILIDLVPTVSGERAPRLDQWRST